MNAQDASIEKPHAFEFHGFLQPSWQWTKSEGQKAANSLRSKRTYLWFSGSLMQEKITFLVRTDFSASTPLLDAWAAWNSQHLSVSTGQRRTFTNNREMTFEEDKLAFPERSLLSTAFCGNGREFGLFAEGRFGNKTLLVPMLALTSGDGPNSFGINSTDVDLGGIKLGGRLDFYPLGDFSEGNTGLSVDAKRESKPKILIGIAGSWNKGASQEKGEGHGYFSLFDSSKTARYPQYRKISADLIVKYRGFSLLAEFANASAAGLSGLRTDSIGGIASLLQPTQIATYLVLGNALNLQAGYFFRNGISVDFRYQKLNPEFTRRDSRLNETEDFALHLGKYFDFNRMKIQATAGSRKIAGLPSKMYSEVMFQVGF
jgi:hypothetical protein